MVQGASQNFAVIAQQFPVIASVLGGLQNGVIGSDGSIVRGTGFTAIRNSAGNYTVTFTSAFGSPPVVLVSVDTTSGITSIRTASVAVGSFGVIASGDTSFSFIAMAA